MFVIDGPSGPLLYGPRWKCLQDVPEYFQDYVSEVDSLPTCVIDLIPEDAVLSLEVGVDDEHKFVRASKETIWEDIAKSLEYWDGGWNVTIYILDVVMPDWSLHWYRHDIALRNDPNHLKMFDIFDHETILCNDLSDFDEAIRIATLARDLKRKILNLT